MADLMGLMQVQKIVDVIFSFTYFYDMGHCSSLFALAT